MKKTKTLENFSKNAAIFDSSQIKTLKAGETTPKVDGHLGGCVIMIGNSSSVWILGDNNEGKYKLFQPTGY